MDASCLPLAPQTGCVLGARAEAPRAPPEFPEHRVGAHRGRSAILWTQQKLHPNPQKTDHRPLLAPWVTALLAGQQSLACASVLDREKNPATATGGLLSSRQHRVLSSPFLGPLPVTRATPTHNRLLLVCSLGSHEVPWSALPSTSSAWPAASTPVLSMGHTQAGAASLGLSPRLFWAPWSHSCPV